MKMDSEKKIVIMCFIFLVIVTAVFVSVNADAKTKATLNDVVEWLVEKHDVPARNDLKYANKIVNQFKESSETFDLPVELLLVIGYKESKFKMNDVGPYGEVGIMQVCPMGIRSCKEYCGEMKTIKEQIDCGSCWLDKGRKWCGDIKKGLSAYMTGKCKLSRRATWKYNKRIELWNKIKEKVGKK